MARTIKWSWRPEIRSNQTGLAVFIGSCGLVELHQLDSDACLFLKMHDISISLSLYFFMRKYRLCVVSLFNVIMNFNNEYKIAEEK